MGISSVKPLRVGISPVLNLSGVYLLLRVYLPWWVTLSGVNLRVGNSLPLLTSGCGPSSLVCTSGWSLLPSVYLRVVYSPVVNLRVVYSPVVNLRVWYLLVYTRVWYFLVYTRVWVILTSAVNPGVGYSHLSC